jgi:hypothetical protein
MNVLKRNCLGTDVPTTENIFRVTLDAQFTVSLVGDLNTAHRFANIAGAEMGDGVHGDMIQERAVSSKQ